MNVVAVASFILYAMSYYVAKKDSFYALLKEEEAKSESLLLNVLPREIAAELKAGGGRGGARKLEEATILFLDLVGFTEISARQDAIATVEMLNMIFTEFDQLAALHGVEKIKTIGDCYMAAAGVPAPRPDHARAAVALALAFGEALKQCSQRFGLPLGFRAVCTLVRCQPG